MCQDCQKKTFYITTPIYYPSDNLHIGHAYCSTAVDTMARFKRMTGYDTYFLDRYRRARPEDRAQGQGEGRARPQAYVDEIVAGIKDLWKLMDISYDDFIRTTEPRHAGVVQKIFKQLYDQGDIYKSEYEGWYCTPCESFWTEQQLDGWQVPGLRPSGGKSPGGKLLLQAQQVRRTALIRIHRGSSRLHPARLPRQ